MVRAQLDSHLADFIKSADLTFFHEYLTDLGFRIKRQREKLQEAEKLYELARLAFIASRKERKVLERVKEKKFELYLIDANREEQKISDEMAILNACRKEGEFE
jgi:flagellar FliJ protein